MEPTDQVASPAAPAASSAVAEERRAQRRSAIVNAAARIFAEAGYDDTEMERVALETGIAKGTLYLYFEGKQDLFFACVDEGMRQLQAGLMEAARAPVEPFER